MDWYHWTRGYRPPKLGGHRRFARAAWCRTTPMSTAKTWMRLNAARCQQVDLCIDELPWQQRAAIGVHAGNKAAGAAVPQSTPVAASAACRLPGRARRLCRRRCAGARCWSLARCDTPIAKALVRVGRPLHNDFRRGKLRPAKQNPRNCTDSRPRVLLPADRRIPTGFQRGSRAHAQEPFFSQDHSVRGARDLRDASASPCARPGGPSFMDARQAAILFRPPFPAGFGVSNGWYYRFAIRSDPGHAAGSVHHEHQRRLAATGLTYADLAITIKDPNFQGGQTTEIDVTVLKSAAKEYALGLDDSGTFSMAGNWKAGDAAQKVLVAPAATRRAAPSA